MDSNIVAWIIRHEYDKLFPWPPPDDSSTWPSPPHDKGMLLKFRIKTHPEKAHEYDGWRYFDILLYGEHNYVGVYTRQRWSVAKLDDEGYVEGDYDEGVSDWTVHTYHDSCWRSSIGYILSDLVQEHKPSGIGECLEHWYTLIDVDDDFRAELKEVRDKKYK